MVSSGICLLSSEGRRTGGNVSLEEVIADSKPVFSFKFFPDSPLKTKPNGSSYQCVLGSTLSVKTSRPGIQVSKYSDDRESLY